MNLLAGSANEIKYLRRMYVKFPFLVLQEQGQ